MAAYRLSAAARADIIDLLNYTERTFGVMARRRYETLLTQAIQDVAADPHRVGSILRPELGGAAYSYHLRHSRDRARTSNGTVRSPRHLLLYRVTHPDLISIGRVLHDAMRPEHHLHDGLPED